MDVEQEIEGLIRRLLAAIDADSYRRALRDTFHTFTDLVERVPEEVDQVLRWADDGFSPPAFGALYDLADLALDAISDLLLPKAGVTTDAMTMTLLGLVISFDGEPVKVSDRFDPSPLVRSIRYGFGIPKGIHVAVEGVFLSPRVFGHSNLVHLLRHRRYAAEALPTVPFSGSIPPWEGWSQLVSAAESQADQRKRTQEAPGDRKSPISTIGCVPITCFGPMGVLEPIPTQPCEEKEYDELLHRLSSCLGISPQHLVLGLHLERPSELYDAIPELISQFFEALDDIIEE